MKTSSKYRWTALFALALVVGCDAAPTQASDNEALVNLLVGMGVPAELIVDEGDRFVVDGDMVFRKSTLRELNPAGGGVPGPSFQYDYGSSPYAGSVLYATINLSGIASNAEWDSAARQAIAAWNAVDGSLVNLTIVSSGADITLSYFYEQSTTVAEADVGVNHDIGPNIRINTYQNGLSYASKVTAIAHEIGHTLGFAHTNWEANGEPRCEFFYWHHCKQLIARTPTSDAGSVMRATVFPWSGFSYYDRVAMRTLWLGDGPQENPYLSGSNPAFTWAPAVDGVQYKIYRGTWFFDAASMMEGVAWTHVGTTTGTSFVDGSRSAGSVRTCWDGVNHPYYTYYKVETVFSEGVDSQSLKYQEVCFQ